jgi:hypothetical protein
METRIGRFEIDSDLGSNENFAIASRRIHTCMTQHDLPQCRHNGDVDLPSRLIDVESLEPRIKVTRGTKGTYVAPSYCWGGQSHFMAKTSNLHEIMTGMPAECLSANFRDAIIITRKLGF